MTNLFKESENGESKQLDFDVKVEDGKIVVEFLQKNYTDHNKWNEKQVLCDLFLNRYVLLDICSKLDPTGEQIKKFIIETYPDCVTKENQIQKMSQSAEEVAIMLPTGRYAHTSRGIPTSIRKYKNTFLPLMVFIDGEDVSRTFQDFYVFGSKAVDVAFDALVNGNIPESKQELVDFSGLEELHQNLCK